MRMFIVVMAILAAAGPAAADRVLRVKKTVVGQCNTDGGSTPCPGAFQFLADAFAFNMNEQLDKEPIQCGPGKPQTVTAAILFEYNEGQFVDPYTRTPPKHLPCVKDVFLPKAKALFKDLLVKVRAVDPRADVRATFTMTLGLGPARP
jgi:hypothetical protein